MTIPNVQLPTPKECRSGEIRLELVVTIFTPQARALCPGTWQLEVAR